MNIIFDQCVGVLRWLADWLGIGYHTLNVWIFCILWPVFTLTLVFIAVRQRRKIWRLKQALENEENSEQAERNQP